MKYDHAKIEKKWREAWEKSKIYTTPDQVPGKNNFYLLVEFPYPSGNLHVGHWYAFAVPDILARKKRMDGKNVLYPIGFDAFGLPAENAAIKNNVNPRDWTESNIAYMKKQIESMGTSFDWSREVSTIDPTYYKWTQWLFLQLYKKGLVYQKETEVNWCPQDMTVLANEQVIDGKCDRCGSEVMQKQMLQWNIKITDYADRLIDDLTALDWPEQIKEAQRNWIGRSEGAEIDFPLDMGQKYKFVILHGFESAPDRPRWIWAKQRLEEMGHKVILPQLPNADDPNEDEWIETALNATEYDDRTVLVGHSLGAVAALKVMEKLEKPIARLVLVGGFIDRNFKDHARPFEERWNWNFDGGKIKSNVGSITVLHDPRDYAVRDGQAKALADLLGVSVTIGSSNEPHFTGDTEPDVVMWLRPTIRVFTTRSDTLFGATYLVLSPEHQWVTLALDHKTVLENNAEVQKYINQAKKKTELERMADQKEKTGVQLKGVTALNPATGEKIPLYVADYVLAHYGTGAIMAVPAHDERDYEFAKKFNLPVREVIEPLFKKTKGSDGIRSDEPVIERNAIVAIVKHSTENKYLGLKWKKNDWQGFVVGGIEANEDLMAAGAREVQEETGYKNLKFVSSFESKVHSQFYHEVKKQNRFAHFTVLYYELENEDRDDVAPEESELHEVVWVDEKSVDSFTSFDEDMQFIWQRFIKPTPYIGEGILTNSGSYDGMISIEAKKEITEAFGRKKKTFKLRDWIVSRQRYWGVPIPIIHCTKCGPQAVPDAQLPVLLPDVEDYLPEGTGKSPLAKNKDFVRVACLKCGGTAERETDTLDTFVDSSWYFLRYTDPKNDKEFADPKKMEKWMPIDLYSGGAEHTTMHLLYSRFWHKALFDLGLVKDSEPYAHRENHGLVLGTDGQKMSKSRGNVMDPDELVRLVGSDAVRIYLAFMGPYTGGASYPWNPDGVVGIRRFLERIWKIKDYVQPTVGVVGLLDSIIHKTVKKIGEDISLMKFNTAISALMILVNAIEKTGSIGFSQWQVFLKLLAPFAPHLAEELWQAQNDGSQTSVSSVHLEEWPSYDPALLVEKEVTIAIQINGKTRGEVVVATDAGKDAVVTAARTAVAERLEGKSISKTIVVPNRLVNFVVDQK